MASPLSTKKTSNKFYLAWVNMRRRCDDPNTKDAHRYIGRGISYENAWSNFDKFYKDMAGSYKLGLSLDRIDNNKGYSKENCRWATPTEQSNNTARNRRITIGGSTKTLAEWIRGSGLKSSTVRQRFYVYGWPIEKSLGITQKEGY